jgi:hypothetical protein
MQEFERLWTYGEPMYDAFQQEDFTLRAIIFVTINDHPVLFALSGQIKGKIGCLVCLDDTKWVFLDGSKKVVPRCLCKCVFVRLHLCMCVRLD